MNQFIYLVHIPRIRTVNTVRFLFASCCLRLQPLASLKSVPNSYLNSNVHSPLHSPHFLGFFCFYRAHIFQTFSTHLTHPPNRHFLPSSSTPSFTQPAHISIPQATSQSRFALRWCRIPQVRRISTSWAWPMAPRRSLPNGIFFAGGGEVYTTPHRYHIASFCVGLPMDFQKTK